MILVQVCEPLLENDYSLKMALSTPASSAKPKTRTREQKWGNYILLWQITQLSLDFTSKCHGMRWTQGKGECNACSLPLPQALSFQWSWLAFLASVLSWQCPFGSSEERRGELVLVQNGIRVAYLSMRIDLFGKAVCRMKSPLHLYQHLS